MATIESIGASGCDYTSVQGWYDAHKGDITADANAPYIGEIIAGELTEDVTMSESTTDASHYFHLRAAAGAGTTPRLSDYTSFARIKGYVLAGDNNCRVERIMVGNSADLRIGFWMFGTNSLVDGCVVYNATGLASVDYCIEMFNGTVRNCIVSKCRFNNLAFPGDCGGIRGSDGSPENLAYCYNNVVDNLKLDGAGTIILIGFMTLSGSPIECYFNNIATDIGTGTNGFSIGTGANVDYNASSDATATGANSWVNIAPADEFVSVTPGSEDYNIKTATSAAIWKHGSDLHGLAGDPPTTDMEGAVLVGQRCIGADWKASPSPKGPFPGGNLVV